ncbi:L-xylulose reductase [Orchesella cincta]|uniref:L-xylulose reductase n=1 Tax=Orchesella cincta TaxID=48709 RepID=A0A1D2MMW3_ORCCI|nr:L-xylulose reductase [Orchesella cincta]
MYRKRVLITGAGQGVGKRLVQRFNEGGAIILALDKNAETIELLTKEFPNVVARVVDITDWDATKKAIESFGNVDHVVNNAAVVMPQKLMEVTRETALLHFEVNTFASINIVQSAARGMIRRGTGGSIVNISSVAAKSAADSSSMYCASKAAVEMLTKSMALELGPHNIRANSISPGLIDSRWQKLNNPTVQQMVERFMQETVIKRPIDPNEIADLVLFLLSPLSAMITGENILIDGGRMCGIN